MRHGETPSLGRGLVAQSRRRHPIALPSSPNPQTKARAEEREAARRRELLCRVRGSSADQNGHPNRPPRSKSSAASCVSVTNVEFGA